jgi:hypothetical protein
MKHWAMGGSVDRWGLDCIVCFLCYLLLNSKKLRNILKKNGTLTSWNIKIGLAAIAIMLLAGCASQPKLTNSRPATRLDTNAMVVANIRSWLAARSLMARSLSTTGDVTFVQNGEANSASFAMKSKRIDEHGRRIDSLSIEVLGPFGIKVARFLASPEQYAMYDILHGQRLTGATDAKSLENLTQLQGITLETMSDLIYGLAATDLRSEDSIRFYRKDGTHYALIVRDLYANATMMLDLEGTLPSDSNVGSLTLVRYLRWNGLLDPMQNTIPPVISVRFSNTTNVNGIPIPQHIEATAGDNKLTLSYDHIDLNPPSLIVKIKMPSQ